MDELAAVFSRDFESAMDAMFPTIYRELDEQACREGIGVAKPLRARYVASRLDPSVHPADWAQLLQLAARLRRLIRDEPHLLQGAG